MRRAILIVGFQNWGKTSLINGLFAREKYYHGWTYKIPGIPADYTVESHSNDDVGYERFLGSIKKRFEPEYNRNSDLFSALCPTEDSREILADDAFAAFDSIHLLALEYKWDLNAQLMIGNVTAQYAQMQKVQVHTIRDSTNTTEQQRALARHESALTILRNIYA